MTRREKTVPEKIGEWHLAYQAVLEDMRLPFNDEVDETPTSFLRTAAIVAAMLVGQGVRLPAESLEVE